MTVKWLLSSPCDGERTLDEGKEFSEPEACRLDAVELVELVLGRAGNTDAILIAMAGEAAYLVASKRRLPSPHDSRTQVLPYRPLHLHPPMPRRDPGPVCSVGTEKLIWLLPQLDVNKQPYDSTLEQHRDTPVAFSTSPRSPHTISQHGNDCLLAGFQQILTSTRSPSDRTPSSGRTRCLQHQAPRPRKPHRPSLQTSRAASRRRRQVHLCGDPARLARTQTDPRAHLQGRQAASAFPHRLRERRAPPARTMRHRVRRCVRR